MTEPIDPLYGKTTLVDIANHLKVHGFATRKKWIDEGSGMNIFYGKDNVLFVVWADAQDPWEWSPTPEDLAADDWYIMPEYWRDLKGCNHAGVRFIKDMRAASEKIPEEVEMKDDRKPWYCKHREICSNMMSLTCLLKPDGCRGLCDKWGLRDQNPGNCRATACTLPGMSGKGAVLCRECEHWKPKYWEGKMKNATTGMIEMRTNKCNYIIMAAVERQIKAVDFMMGGLKAKNVELGSACMVDLFYAQRDLQKALEEFRKEVNESENRDPGEDGK